MSEPWRVEIRKEAARIEEDALYRYKTHYNDAERWETISHVFGIPGAIGAVLLSGSAGAAAAAVSQPWVTATLAIGAAILAALSGSLRPGARASEHDAAGNRFKSLNAEARVFWKVDLPVLRREDATERLHALMRQRDKDYAGSPKTSHAAYKRAKEGIEKGEATYVVDKENA